MSGKVLELQGMHGRDKIAEYISYIWDRYNSERREWMDEKNELRQYLFATDTTKTTNNQLPWKNKTVTPKLTQIRDNLHANYMSALFPNDDWLKWEGYSSDSETKSKKQAITAYMSNKLRQQNFRNVVSKLLYDYIDYGNAFADVYFEEDVKTDRETGETITRYIGPKAVRISPVDIVFNPMTVDFDSSPNITRHIKTLGEIKKDAEAFPELGYDAEAIEKAAEFRRRSHAYREADVAKAVGFEVDGFGSAQEYLQSDYVEILEFEGDYHDQETGKLHQNMLVTVIDRSYVIRSEQNPIWVGKTSKCHTGWRKRPDNLWAMGPLDNLVGMQYRIDHLENIKADAMDLAVFPPMVVQGDVEEFVWQPGEEIYVGENGMITELGKNFNGVMAANNDITLLENKMEEMAGAPRQAMGIRTPGEKTAYEVQTLENAAGRIFQEKITQFETELLEPLLNRMLEVAVRNMDGNDLIRVMDDDIGVVDFLSITKEDITASGKLRPVGARHFSARAQLIQNLTGLMNSPVGQAVMPHMSSKNLSKMVEDVLGLGRYDLFKDNAAIMEQAETMRLQQQIEEDLQAEQQQSPEGGAMPQGGPPPAPQGQGGDLPPGL